MLFSKPGLPLKIALAMALSVGSTSAALANSAAACQAGQAGCVIPVQDAVSTPAPVSSTPTYVDEDGGGGIGLLPILALLAAAAAILYFTVLDDDEEAVSP